MERSSIPSIKGKLMTSHPSSESGPSIMQTAKYEALQSGLYGAGAGAAQILLLMWLRTAVNYQYKYGVTLDTALHELYKQGGIARFYQGFFFAMIQGPLAKFGAVAANDGSKVLANAYMDPKYATAFATMFGTILTVLWRYFLMPIDTCKTILQVQGSDGLHQIFTQVVQNGRISLLYQGSLATMLCTFAGHYPWFCIHNYMESVMVVPKSISKVGDFYLVRSLSSSLSPSLSPLSHLKVVLRSAFIGFVSSVASDIPSNFIRVIKIGKQASPILGNESPPSYIEIISTVYNEGGLWDLLFRGLMTRILANALQSIIFTVLWKLLPMYFSSQKKKKEVCLYTHYTHYTHYIHTLYTHTIYTQYTHYTHYTHYIHTIHTIHTIGPADDEYRQHGSADFPTHVASAVTGVVKCGMWYAVCFMCYVLYSCILVFACGVVWFSVVWFSVVWRGVVWCSVVWYSVV